LCALYVDAGADTSSNVESTANAVDVFNTLGHWVVLLDWARLRIRWYSLHEIQFTLRTYVDLMIRTCVQFTRN